MQINILVTGSNGQLGKSLQKIASSYTNYNFIFTSKDELAIENETVVDYFFEKYQPLFCINCAAYTAVDRAEEAKEIALQINAIGPKILAEAALKYNCKLIHISTDYVFDGLKKNPYLENDTTNPINYYGVTKLLGEKNIEEINNESIIIRTSWLYSEFGHNFLKTMMKLMQEKESINVVNDQIGTPTYAVSLANVLMKIIALITSNHINIKGIYHFSNEGQCSWFEFAYVIKEIIKSNCLINPISTEQFHTPAKRSPYSVLDKSKIKKELGIEILHWREDLQICLKNIEFQQ